MNRKGFMLAEVVIVSSVVIATVVGLYNGFSSLYKAYDTRNRYYDVNSMYALKNLEEFLIDELAIDTIVTKTNFNYQELKESSFTEQYNKTFFKNFLDIYNLKNVYLIQYDETNIKNFSNTVDADLKKYLEFYIDKIYQQESSFDNKKYSYMLVSVTKDYMYSTFRIK